MANSSQDKVKPIVISFLLFYFARIPWLEPVDLTQGLGCRWANKWAKMISQQKMCPPTDNLLGEIPRGRDRPVGLPKPFQGPPHPQWLSHTVSISSPRPAGWSLPHVKMT